MTNNNINTRLLVNLYILLGFFSFPHLIDDFLFGIPDEFGLNVQFTQLLSGIFLVLYILILIMLVKGNRRGLYWGIFMGIFLALAGILKHIPLIIKPGPYWSGWFSETLIFGMILSGIALTIMGVRSLMKLTDGSNE